MKKNLIKLQEGLIFIVFFGSGDSCISLLSGFLNEDQKMEV